MFHHHPLSGGTTVGVLTTDGPIFLSNGTPVRLKGVTAFGQMNRFARGLDIDPFIADVDRAWIHRAWPYVTWPVTGWEPPPVEVMLAYLSHMASRGKWVYMDLLTDDDPRRITWAIATIDALAAAKPTNLILTGGNEPTTHKNINTAALRPALERSGFLYGSGNYEDSDLWFGSIYDNHTERDDDWIRRCHDLFEFYGGSGPDKPTHPHRVACFSGEPKKPQDVPTDRIREFRAYFGGCALLGAGAFFHCESAKYAHTDGRLSAMELELFNVAMDAMDAFPADAPKGSYNRPIDTTLRTYVVGNHMVRMRPTTLGGVVPGTMIDTDGILWNL